MKTQASKYFFYLKQFPLFGFYIFSIISLTHAQVPQRLMLDVNWQKTMRADDFYYRCEFYTDENNQLQGAFNCYEIKTDALVKQYNFTDDKLDGEVWEYYADGTLKLKAKYNKGLPVDEWYEYDYKGRIKLHKTFDNESRLVKSYAEKSTPYDKHIASKSIKKEEPPIYSSECLRIKIDEQKYACSEEAILNYISNPPIPPQYKEDVAYKGKTIQCVLSFRINKDGIVDDTEIVESTGDEFLDELAKAHVLNMVPFESAKEYGTPIHYWKDVIINFKF